MRFTLCAPHSVVRLVVAMVVLAAGANCAGCIEKLAPDQVAMGVGRLTVRHAAIIAKIVETDTTCGFANERVLRAAFVQGNPGQEGAVTYKVENCEVEFKEPTEITHDCLDVIGRAQGKMTFTATKRIVGTVTGDPSKPVIPASADSVHIEVDATFQDFKITRTDSQASLNTHSGALHFKVDPKVALSKSLGVCAIPTLDLSFTELRYTNAKVTVADGDHVFPADVPTSDFVAQVGKWKDQVNSFSGSITVWDSKQTVPIASDTKGLDELYTEQGYSDSVSCDQDLVTPISYACPSLKEQIVHGVARLTMGHLGAVAGIIDADTRCGFSSTSVLNAAQINGTVGGLGTATFALTTPCTITFIDPKVVSTDCNGAKQTVQGSLTVRGTKTMKGVLTGDVTQPVAPNGREPASLDLTIDFTNFKVTGNEPTPALTVVGGTLKGKVTPQVAIDARTDICSHVTSVASLQNVEWKDGRVELFNDGLTFQLTVSTSSLQAQNGKSAEHENYLEGLVIADDVPYSFPPPGAAPVLDPAYDPVKFEQSYSCKPGFRFAVDDSSCAVDKALAVNVARLTVLAAGTLAGVVKNDKVCGFSAMTVQTHPSNVTGDDGQMGTIEWDIQNCRLGQTAVVNVDRDCLGTNTYMMGTASTDAHMRVEGLRNTKLLIFDSIIPVTRDAVSFTLKKQVLAGFSIYTVKAGEAAPYAQLTIHQGQLTGTVHPTLGERTSKPGTYDIPTPVATFTDIELINATVTLAVAGKTFNFVVPALRVEGQSGSHGGKSNSIAGTVTLGSGAVYTIPGETQLDPEFQQATFDNGYSCTADLVGVVPPN